MRRLARFLSVGTAVFVLDIGLLHVLTTAAALTLIQARLVSLPCAASAGWLLHRQVTFLDRQRRPRTSQWSRYLLVNLGSGTVNFGIYALLLAAFPLLRHDYVLAVMPAAGTGTLINFLCANFWVFR